MNYLDNIAGNITNGISPYHLETLVSGSEFHTINGLAFGPDRRLYIASVAGESLFALDIQTGAVEIIAGPPDGLCDDLVFTDAGEIIWTANLVGAVRVRGIDGSIRDLATNLPGINSIAFTRDGKRLFAAQVFMGEGLWELDLHGAKAPRLVLAKTGGLNAFQFGADGMIYGPSWNNGTVLRIDPDSGDSEVIATGLKHPGAVRFDLQDRLYALDDATGELFRLDGDEASLRLVAHLATATDNMIVGPDGAMYVSNMADNSITRVDLETGQTQTLLHGRLAFPRSIAVSSGPDGVVIHVADGCSYRRVNSETGEVRDIARVVETELGFPVASVSLSGEDALLLSELAGTLQIFEKDSTTPRPLVSGLQSPAEALRIGERIVVTEPQQGRVVLIEGESKRVLTDGLSLPVCLADAGAGAVYVGECGRGRLLRVSMETGSVESIAKAPLGAVRSITLMPDRSVVVLDGSMGALYSVNPVDGGVTLLARDLPVGYLSHPYPRSGGIASAPDGTIYIAADRENSLYSLKPQQP